MERWKNKFATLPDDKRPDSYASAIKSCDSHLFPNVHSLLKLGCTTPVTNVNVILAVCSDSATTCEPLRVSSDSGANAHSLQCLCRCCPCRHIHIIKIVLLGVIPRNFYLILVVYSLIHFAVLSGCIVL